MHQKDSSSMKEKDVITGSQLSFSTPEKQAYQNTTRPALDPDDGLPGSSRLSQLITEAIEQEVGPLVQFDD